MAAVQFIFSIIIAVCVVAMFLSAILVQSNPNIVVSTFLFILCVGTFQMVKISYKELKS